MSNYTTLKTTINSNIGQNGNQEITGKILNSVLNAMVNTLGEGYQFAGIAITEIDPGTPDAKVFYIANGKGTYTNFGGLEVTEDEVVFLVWDNVWHKVATGIAADAKLKEAVTELTEIAGKVENKQDIIPDLDAIRQGAEKGSTALQKESDPVYLADRPSLLLAIDGKVSKEPGKGLSHNDFTDAEKSKLAGLENYDDTQIRELIAGKANLQHQHTVADITDFPELYYDATAFFTSGAYPSDRYEELLEAVRAKRTVYATIDEEGHVSYVFFMSSANSDGSSSRVLLTTIFADGGYLYINTFVLQQSGMTPLQESITGKADKATTLAGYGIGDAYTKSEVDTALEGKQDTLTAGNGISIEGNVISSSVAEVVDNIVNAGYVFAGVATPATNPGTPDAKVFYIANGKGTYEKFGGINVTEDDVVVLYWDSAWHKVATGIASQAKLSELDSQVSEIHSEVYGQNQEIADFKETITNQIDNFRPIVVEGNVTNAPDEEDITTDESNLLKFANRGTLHGMGYVILRKDKTFAEQVTQVNTIYEIRYDFDLGDGEVGIPDNCVLKFIGGSISNGVLALNDAYLEGNPKILCNVSGSISNKTNDVTFFGVDNTGQTDCSARLQHLLSALGAVHFPQGTFLVTNQVIMPKTAMMTGEGRGSVIKIAYDGYAFLYPYDSQIANNWFQYSFRDISVQGDYPVIEDETTPKTRTSFLQTENGTYPLSMEVIGCYFTRLYCAFNIEQAYWTRINNSIFFYMGDAIIVSECNSSVFTNNMFRGCKGTAITINPRQKRDSSVATATLGMTISGNDFSESLNAGIRVFCEMQSCEISGNYFESMVNGAWQQIVVGDPVKKYGVTAMMNGCSIVGNSGMWQERGGIKVVNGVFNGNICQGYVNIDDDSVANRNIGCSTNKQSALLLGYVNGNVIANANPFGIESKIRQYSAKHVVIPANSTLILRDISIACYSDFRVLFFQSASISDLKLRISGIAESDIDITSMEEPLSWFSAINRYTLAAKARNVTLKIVNSSENCMITDIDLIMSYNLYRDK